MRTIRILITTAAAVCVMGALSTAYGLLTPVDFMNGPQDPLLVPETVHELVTAIAGVPQSEQIGSLYLNETSQTACFDGNDQPQIANQYVQIQNLTGLLWEEVWYVADPGIGISNFDGWIGNQGVGDQQPAFKIDSVGINQPLLSESMIPDNMFQPGEIWEFIIQDYQGAAPNTAANFGSAGIASASASIPTPSTASILAVPEPGTIALAIGAALALVTAKRLRK